jgi:type II secretory pathway component PulL
MSHTPTGKPDDTTDEDRVRFRATKLRQTRSRDWLIRFGFGAGVSAVAGVVGAIAGPTAGGVFLAFPAILLASVTLVAKEDGVRHALDDARGATYGTLGLVVFALVILLAVDQWPLWLVLSWAILAWLVVALTGYLTAQLAGAGRPRSSRHAAHAG